jgi:osmotically-inducible protein OsmY
MNQASRARHQGAWISVGLLTILLTTAAVVPAAAAPPDAWITTKVKLSLLTAEGFTSGTAVNVDTVNGQVALHGKVSSQQEKETAEATARKIDGVQGVRNLLQVVAPAREHAVEKSDEDIKKQVQAKLKADPSIQDSSISVQSVNNGVVLLAGTANSLMDHLSAVETAARVPGVRRVASEIQSPDQIGDKEIWRERQTELSKTGHDVGDSARDMWITSATKMRLLADSHTPALDINVDTRDGVVTLFGMVPSIPSKTAAEADARKVSGVKHVVNELQVVPKPEQKAVKAKDDVLEREVKKAFENHQDLKDIKVEVKNCVARLSGSVPNGMHRLEAAVVARSTRGVCSVQDDLRIAN